MRTPSRPVLTIALGVLLVASSLCVGALGLDETNRYRYESGEVAYDGGLVAPDRPLPDAEGIDDDVACLRGQVATRTCAIERAILRRGGLTVPVDPAGLDSNFAPTDYRYVYADDRFYEIETERRDGETVLTVNRTPPEQALRAVSAPLSEASPAVRTAVETGGVETAHRLREANRLFRRDGSYYVVYPVSERGPGPGSYRNALRGLGRAAETALGALAVGAGLLLVLRGQRRRVERERPGRE